MTHIRRLHADEAYCHDCRTAMPNERARRHTCAPRENPGEGLAATHPAVRAATGAAVVCIATVLVGVHEALKLRESWGGRDA